MSTNAFLARRSGVLVEWNDARGFGFITPDSAGPRLFAHVSSFPPGRRPVAGCEVTFVETRDPRGRPRAEGVQYVGRPPRARSSGAGRAGAVAALFLAVVAALVVLDEVPTWVLAAYALASAVAFAAYDGDKRAAVARRRRTPESTLHAIALLGGWPGALLAQQVLRHKTVKQPFRTLFWGTVLLNCAGLAWLVVAGVPALP